MSLFNFGSSSAKYGVIIDVGSGSVLVSIVESNSKQEHPTIVWSHREPAPLKNIDSLEQSINSTITALVQASMQLDSVGRKILKQHNPTAKLTELQCGISAPWAYTVTKSVNYNQEEEFEITKALVEDLLDSVKDSADSELEQSEEARNMKLKTIARSTISTLANGYAVTHPEGQKAKQLEIFYTNAISQGLLIDAVAEMRDKLFHGTECRKISFMLIFYVIVRELLINSNEVCLLDVTYEATEIGVMRDGVLRYCTHTPFGAFSLAREISAITKAPLSESFAHLKSADPHNFLESLPKDQRTEVEAVLEAYVEKVSELFKETGDALSIPKQIIVHTDLKMEPLFIDLIEKAAKRNLKSNPVIKSISKEIIKLTYTKSTKGSKVTIPEDTALLVSAQFFHKRDDYLLFEYI